MLKKLLAKRAKTGSHKSPKYQCSKPWEVDREAAQMSQIFLVETQLEHLKIGKKSLFVDAEEVSEDEDDEEEAAAVAKPAADDSAEDTSFSFGDSGSSLETASLDQPKEKISNVELFNHTIRSQGIEYTIENVPKTHAVVPKAHLRRLQNKEKKLNELEKQFKRKRFAEVSMRTKTALGMALVSVPALALRAAQYFIPSVVASFLMESGILDYRAFDPFVYARSFPSEFYFRSLMYELAAKCLLAFAVNLKHKRVFLSCDKGNKKGVGHFIKMLSYWADGQVQFKCLDMDASQGDTNSCADAIQHSLKSVGSIKLQGSTTDSGGGGVLDSLARSLESKGLCNTNYKVAGCSIHTFQLTLAVPTQKVLGEGGLGMKNVMQLVHSVYDLQESLDFEEYVEVMVEARAFVSAIQSNAEYDYGETTSDQEFKAKIDMIASFYNDQFHSTKFDVGKKIKKMSAPVLTRWWYVGEACKYVWQNYLAVAKGTQMVINRN